MSAEGKRRAEEERVQALESTFVWRTGVIHVLDKPLSRRELVALEYAVRAPRMDRWETTLDQAFAFADAFLRASAQTNETNPTMS
jgi:hypothetical protein